MTDIAQIKADLRAAMNGVAAKTIRESGMDYRLVYGVELPRLREIASAYPPDRRLAQALWQEDIRECKMLAIMCYPHDEFDRDVASLWVESLRPQQAELAQLMAMDLLCHLPEASDLAFCWMADEREMFQLCGYLTLTRLLMQGAVFSPASEAEFLDQAAAALSSTFLPLRKAVQNALLRYEETTQTETSLLPH